jgi:hypothetical protein
MLRHVKDFRRVLALGKFSRKEGCFDLMCPEGEDAMKRLLVGFLLAVGLTVPSICHAYFGARVGVADERNFGYGLAFGVKLPNNFLVSLDMTGYIVKQGSGATKTTSYWVQADLDGVYDFHHYFEGKDMFVDPELHPYVKLGATYAGFAIDAISESAYRANHGPGFNAGGGVDWKLREWITFGIDLSEAMVFLRGVTVSGVTSPSATVKVFNAMAVLKFFAY